MTTRRLFVSSARSLFASAGLLLAITAPTALYADDKPVQPPAVTPAAAAPTAVPAAQPVTIEKAPEPAKAALEYVEFKTSAGTFLVELNREKAPISTENFLKYADKGFYAGTIFHRVIKDFMIQGGGMDTSGTQKPTDAPITNEWKNGLKNTKGTLAMARTGAPDSATSQFFINTVDNPSLDQPRSGGAAYAVFGKVVAGFDTIETIRNGAVGPQKMGGENSNPASPVSVESAVRMTKEQAEAAMKNTKAPTPAEPKADPAMPDKK